MLHNNASDYIVNGARLLANYNKTGRGWRDGSAVRTYCSSEDMELVPRTNVGVMLTTACHSNSREGIGLFLPSSAPGT